MKASTFEKSSFFLRIPCRCESLQQALSLYLHAFSCFTSNDRAHIMLASYHNPNCLQEGELSEQQHHWNVDLTAVANERCVVFPEQEEKEEEEEEILMFTHIEGCRFVFRVFDQAGNEKSGFSLAKTCLCCAKLAGNNDAVDKHGSSPVSGKELVVRQNLIRETPKARAIENFSIRLPKVAVRSDYFVNVPRILTKCMPFSTRRCDIFVVAKVGEMSMQWKVRYSKYEYDYNFYCRLERGWREVAQTLELEEGDCCEFNLIDAEIWAYELKVIRNKEGTREAELSLEPMAE